MYLKKAIEIATQAHEGQKYGELAYTSHLYDVLLKATSIFGNKYTIEDRAIAFLHDIVEDTDVDLGLLLNTGFSEYIVAGVSLLTKQDNLTYKQNIQRIIDSNHLGAIMTKYADNSCNYSSLNDITNFTRKSRLQKQYSMSMDMLKLALEHHNIVI